MAAKPRVQIVHAVPSRVRLRCPGVRDDPGQSIALEKVARALPGFESVSIRSLTESVVIRYSLEDTTPAEFHRALARQVDLDALPSPPAPTVPPPAPPLGARLTWEVRRWWDRADRELLAQTRGTLDLRSSVPWFMLFLALRQIVTSRQLPAFPWYTALYYALQAIMRCPPEPEEGSAAPDPPDPAAADT